MISALLRRRKAAIDFTQMNWKGPAAMRGLFLSGFAMRCCATSARAPPDPSRAPLQRAPRGRMEGAVAARVDGGTPLNWVTRPPRREVQ